MFRVAIVDDDPRDAGVLATMLERFGVERKLTFEPEAFGNVINFLEKYSPRFDLVFMDIDMPGLDGLSAARKLRERDTKVALVFVTNLGQYAINGYEVDAIDFIVKPVKYFPFAMKMDRVLERLRLEDGVRLRVHTQNGDRIVTAGELMYVEAFDDTLVYHTTTGKLEGPGPLSVVEQALAGTSFFRCNRCYLVNLKFVTAARESTATVGGDELAISRRRYLDFLDALNKYFNGGGNRSCMNLPLSFCISPSFCSNFSSPKASFPTA